MMNRVLLDVNKTEGTKMRVLAIAWLVGKIRENRPKCVVGHVKVIMKDNELVKEVSELYSCIRGSKRKEKYSEVINERDMEREGEGAKTKLADLTCRA